MISISLFLGVHIELNMLGTRDISCVRNEIQIWNTISNKRIFFDLIIFRTLVLMWKSSGKWPPGSPTRWNCVTSTSQELISSTFKVCLSVRDRWSTILTQYHQELINTALYWLIPSSDPITSITASYWLSTTKYQPSLSSTQLHHLVTHSWANWI